MVKENPFGEWFRSVLSRIADYAPKIGSALGTIIPIAPAVGQVVGSAAGGLRLALPGSKSNGIGSEKKMKKKK
jgi:hypothetical protein